LYVYVVVAPPSYEHAHTSMVVVHWQSLLLEFQHTVPTVTASPIDGCPVLSQPVYFVPHFW